MLVAAGLMTGLRQNSRTPTKPEDPIPRDDDLRNRGLLRERLCKGIVIYIDSEVKWNCGFAR